MTLPKSRYLPLVLLLAISSLAVRAASPPTPDFSGIWRLNEQQSDSPSDIAARLHAEKKLEQPVQQPATAASSGTPASHTPGGHGGGRGMGGGGMGGGGHGHGGGGRSHDKTATTDNGTAAPDDPPPLLANDSLMNVQQDAKDIRVAFDEKDQLDGRLDGTTHQSLSGNALVQTRLTAEGLQISMQFEGGVRLRQDWVQSPDGHHLTVIETWTTPAVQQPIVFKRSYDRLDI
ncbi:hypothetical protein GCM10008098_12660 [Rhodanobacter panaciterrae]|uniref:Uncharacterized protein n=1 Tax=Rhodanobacter panaciterrae TaxID=490572 RepID=A0ABQ2ZRV0_9GAMM|nr:hypothetical protein [Rhodanobacter panaciterrae]GGY21345.1 hypothetical protein GCM10008098_12660 [Rhodanobacter panaciterrae]